jgi:periplasmic divalent cation tolerance protein
VIQLVLSTCGPAEAETLGRQLVEERLAACCNAIPGVKSTYWWQGALCTDEETLLVFKTTPDLLDDFMERLQELHPYETPEILALPVEKGLDKYLAWVERETR